MAEDGFETYFTEKLWEMIPAIYRHEDGVAARPGVLRSMIEVLAQQAAILRRSHDRLWEDQFIELCDDWAIPYLGDLVGTRMVSALDPRAQRVDVAKTIHYRRRKGTLAVLEELISDTTGWDGTVVECFRRLGRTWHRLDPPPGARAGRISRTPPGGWADLRQPCAAQRTYGPFDEFHHTPDMRRHRDGNGVDGRYGIPKLAFHLYRLQAYQVTGVPPSLIHGNDGYTVDPSGRDVPLFMPARRPQSWRPAREWELPAPIECRLLAEAEARDALLPHAINVENAPGAPLPAKTICGANLGENWTTNAPAGKQLLIDPERGRLLFVGGAPSQGATVNYHYGFSGSIGAGSYARPEVERRMPDVHIKPGGGPLGSANSIPTKGIAQIDDSATYGPIADQPAIEDLILQAASHERPYLRLAGHWVLDSGANEDAYLLLDGLWIGSSGASEIILRGDFEEVVMRNVTLDPGGPRTEDAGIDVIPETKLVVEGHVECLKIDSCITGGIRTRDNGVIETLIVQDSILQAQPAAPKALALASGDVTLERVTVMGQIDVHRLWATEALVTDEVRVIDNQAGCFRFGAAGQDSWLKKSLPRPYESHEITEIGQLFTSRRFGNPAYAQLSSAAPMELRRGAENGSEIGAFSSLLNTIKMNSLRAKVDEFMPFGSIPIFIEET